MKIFCVSLAALVLPSLVACSASSPSVASAEGASTAAPTHADTGCVVVLRTAIPNGTNCRTVTSGEPPKCDSYSVDVTVDVAVTDVHFGDVPFLRVMNARTADLRMASAGGSPEGFQRFVVTAQLGAGPDVSLIPFVTAPDGTQEFDHNRRPLNYVLDFSNEWTIEDDPSKCQTAP